MTTREKIIALYEKRPKTDRDLVGEHADVITEALSHKVKISELFDVMRESGFKSSRKTFTLILQEQGLYTIKTHQKREEA